jgi:predicted amidophosphoribosyltransferase
VIPFPLDKKRLKKRGYNQVEGFGIEIAKALQVPYLDKILIKDIKTNSQVFKKRFNRFHTAGVFKIVQPKLLDHQHVLLVDDIITTGATIEKCAHQLFKSEQVKLSLATIAIA